MTTQIHYIYKITFLIGKLNDCYYIGKRTTNLTKTILNKIGNNDIFDYIIKNPMFDNYTGSGSIPKSFFKTHKKVLNKTFTKEILCFSNSFDENLINEKNIIGNKYKTDEKCVNLIKGGMYNPVLLKENNPTYKTHLTDEQKYHLSVIMKEYCKTHEVPWKGKHKTDIEKYEISKKLKKYYETHSSPTKGTHHTNESKKKNSDTHKLLMKNENYRKKIIDGIKKFYAEHESPLKGRKLSEKRKQEMSKQFKGKPNYKNRGKNNGMYGKKPANCVKILQFSNDGNFIKEWESIKDAANSVNGKSSNILKVCKGERKKAYNYIWKYK